MWAKRSDNDSAKRERATRRRLAAAGYDHDSRVAQKLVGLTSLLDVHTPILNKEILLLRERKMRMCKHPNQEMPRIVGTFEATLYLADLGARNAVRRISTIRGGGHSSGPVHGVSLGELGGDGKEWEGVHNPRYSRTSQTDFDAEFEAVSRKLIAMETTREIRNGGRERKFGGG
eukprot:2391498-Prymnesium_polylepis.2